MLKDLGAYSYYYTAKVKNAFHHPCYIHVISPPMFEDTTMAIPLVVLQMKTKMHIPSKPAKTKWKEILQQRWLFQHNQRLPTLQSRLKMEDKLIIDVHFGA